MNRKTEIEIEIWSHSFIIAYCLSRVNPHGYSVSDLLGIKY